LLAAGKFKLKNRARNKDRRENVGDQTDHQGHRESADGPGPEQEKEEVDLVALDDALNTLTALDPRQSRIIELRFFGGLSIQDTAVVLGISPATVKREWTMARMWLHRELIKDVTQ